MRGIKIKFKVPGSKFLGKLSRFSCQVSGKKQNKGRRGTKKVQSPTEIGTRD